MTANLQNQCLLVLLAGLYLSATELGTLQAEKASCSQDLPDEATHPQGQH